MNKKKIRQLLVLFMKFQWALERWNQNQGMGAKIKTKEDYEDNLNKCIDNFLEKS